MNLNPNAKNVYGAYSSYSSYIAMPPTVAHPRTDRIRMRRSWRWLALASLLCAAALRPEAAMAQTVALSRASIFEGNAGTRVLKIPFDFIEGPQPVAVTGTVRAVGTIAQGWATSGAACGGNVDFVHLVNVPFTIAPNTPNGTHYINIQICGDTVIERNEEISVSATLTGGGGGCKSCSTIGTILNDDGPPGISINNISISEPLARTRNATFTVSLGHASALETRVNFRTRDGTARAPCFDCLPPVVSPDYNVSSGTLTIAPNVLTGTISVAIRGDQVPENAETFFVDLSAPVNATIFDGTGQATIIDTTLSTGGFDLTPAAAEARTGETVDYTLDWTVPDNLVWRNLKSLDFRLRDHHRTALWLRWDEASNRFSLCSSVAGHDNHADDDDEGDDRRGALARAGQQRRVVCGPGELPGTGAILATPFALVHMSQTAVVGSGPTGQRVTLKLSLQLLERSAGHTYRVGLAAADDFGNEDPFVRAATLVVQDRSPRQR